MTNYTQLYKENRNSIEELLKNGYNFTDIAKAIKKVLQKKYVMNNNITYYD